MSHVHYLLQRTLHNAVPLTLDNAPYASIATVKALSNYLVPRSFLNARKPAKHHFGHLCHVKPLNLRQLCPEF
jgi:hypothetical protein